jgi:hypothetical protein
MDMIPELDIPELNIPELDNSVSGGDASANLPALFRDNLTSIIPHESTKLSANP